MDASYCQKYAPIAPEEALAGVTVIENTYMKYTAPKFCDDQQESLTYSLSKPNG